MTLPPPASWPGPVRAGQARAGQVRAGQVRAGPARRRDAVRNYHRIMAATRDVLGESGADASMEEIAARAGVGVGTVYRRFASKDALIDELVRLVLSDLLSAADLALDRADGHGLEQFLRAAGAMFAEHSRYASLLLQRSPERETASRIRAAIGELTSRAVLAGTVNPGLAAGDVIALLWAMNRVAENTAQTAPGSWQRFLDVHLAGLRAPGQLSTVEPMPAQ